MKPKLLLLICGVFFLNTGVAQNIISPRHIGKSESVTLQKQALYNQRAVTDTVDFEMYNTRSTVLSFDIDGGYVFGTNEGGSTASAQAFYMGLFGNYNQYGIIECLIWPLAKYKNSTNGSSLTVTIQKMDDSVSYGPPTTEIACPGTVLATSAVIPWSAIDTSSTGGFTVATFPNIVYVTTDYAIVVDYSNFAANQDTIGFASTTSGATSFPDNQLYLYPDVTPFWVSYKDVYGLNSNLIAYWAVIDRDYIGVEGADFAFGMKLSAYPNPSENNVKISYELKDGSDITLSIFDITGKKVFEKKESNILPGKVNSVDVDLSGLSNGPYYYSLTTGGNNRVTKKFIIAK